MRVAITKSAHAAIRGAARYEFDDSSSLVLPNGLVEIELCAETTARMEEIAFPGESASDTIERIIARAFGQGQN